MKEGLTFFLRKAVLSWLSRLIDISHQQVNRKKGIVNNKVTLKKFLLKFIYSEKATKILQNLHLTLKHPFKTSVCLREGGVSPWVDGRKVTVHKDQKSPS